MVKMEKLIKKRKECGYTQVTFAKQLGTAQPNVSAIENGHTNPTYPMIKKILKVLDCTFEEIF